MKLQFFKPALMLVLVIATLFSCNQGNDLKPYSEETNSPAAKPKALPENSENSEHNHTPASNQLHTVTVNEVLPAQKYVYVYVTDEKQQYWVATMKKEITVGGTYFFRGGLLKTNFESKEYNRMFDKIYLVSQFVPATHGGDVHSGTTMKLPIKTDESEKSNPKKTEKRIKKPGSVSIADLVSNPQKYEGQTVQVSGVCFKINPKIMGRNWIHLRDGSRDDFDLVITSNEFVPEGMEVTLKALVVLNKDYGSGYKYDLILENGKVMK
jgi:hypothetical protein